MHVEELDRNYLFHPMTNLAAHAENGPHMTIVEGHGATVTDRAGRDYLDAMAGLWCVNVGYAHPEMAEALREQALKLPYFHAFSSMGTDLPARLSERLINMAPVPMSKVFYGNSGSDANDTQAKLVWYYNNVLGRPMKKKIIARRRGYHGVTVLSGGLTGLKNLHDGFDLPLPMIRHIRPPHGLWEREPGQTDDEFATTLAIELDRFIVNEGPETVAALIAEPVMAAGGVIVPPDTYFPKIQEVLDKYDVLLIADEVVNGFGRLGVSFGSVSTNMKPDLMTVAKGITSAYVPLSAVLVSDKVWQVLLDGSAKYGSFGHGYTYSAHPLAAAAAMTNLDIIERDGLVDRVAENGKLLHELLHTAFADHPNVGEIRGRGLMAAVEFVESREPLRPFAQQGAFAGAVTRAALENGVITRALPAADTVSFSPPFVTTPDELERMVAGVRAGLDHAVGELRSK
ncbi:aminotransferase [Microbacterium gallinarum]|uniref:Aminotransferase class III-fold pyridoxal phosphate-dependent enzyme n=1 Tax=Microbacterium gallinarum TaxID=2762209 RepID=A0ABR8X273_9MICO|nr:aminotransferase [Microbacterium gallinarum]MBD8023293.1 aminotransferase class III-fold pyridoxal phosphate-dependent enzyme [Microbacterium gallinarum]